MLMLIPQKAHSFLQGFSPTKFRSKIVIPCLLLPPTERQKFGPPPLFVVPPIDLYDSDSNFPPPKIFDLYIAGLHKQTSTTVST